SALHAADVVPGRVGIVDAAIGRSEVAVGIVGKAGQHRGHALAADLVPAGLVRDRGGHGEGDGTNSVGDGKRRAEVVGIVGYDRAAGGAGDALEEDELPRAVVGIDGGN